MKLPKSLTDRVPSTDAANLPRSQWPVGMVEPPNIDLRDRPTVHNPDGTTSSMRSATFEQDGHSIVIPTVSDDGKILSAEEAIAQYRQTGRHFGKFVTTGATPWQFSDQFAMRLHDDYAANAYGAGRSIQKSPIQATPVNATVPSPFQGLRHIEMPSNVNPNPETSLFAGLRHAVVSTEDGTGDPKPLSDEETK